MQREKTFGCCGIVREIEDFHCYPDFMDGRIQGGTGKEPVVGMAAVYGRTGEDDRAVGLHNGNIYLFHTDHIRCQDPDHRPVC